MTDWSRQRTILEQMKKETETRLERTGQYGLDDAMADQLGELSMYDNHPADIGDELFERGKDLALRDNAHIRLQEIDRALAALDAGTYGTCAACGRPIPMERIEAMPTATMCAPCKDADEAQHVDRNRPVEEEFLQPAFGRSSRDHGEAVEFDGEDAWQAVERFNERPDFPGDYEQLPLDDNEGIVEQTDRISNDEYEQQLP